VHVGIKFFVVTIAAKTNFKRCIVCSSFLYLVFALILGATCERQALHNDYMIAEKVNLAVGLCQSPTAISLFSMLCNF